MVKHVNTAMIMAAGKGTRMMPLTADRPVNAHYRADQVESHLAAHATDFDVSISDERDLLRDTGGGLVQALPMILDDPFICVNADNWWTNDGENAISRLMAHWDAARMDVLMLLVPLATAYNSQGIGDFNMDTDGRLSRRVGDAPAPYVWTGIQLLSKKLIVDPPSDVFSTNVFWDRAIAHGRCMGLVHEGMWFDVGYPAAITATEERLGLHGIG